MDLKNKKRLCFIIEANGWGGAEAHTLSFITYLLSKDYYIELVSCRNNLFHNDYSRMDPSRIKIIRTNLSIHDNPKLNSRLWGQFLRQIESNTLVFQHLSHDHGRLPFFRVCRRYFKKVYFIEHTFPPSRERGDFREHCTWIVRDLRRWGVEKVLQRKRIFNCADKIIAVSDDVRRKLIKDLAYPPQRTVTVRNGIDWRHFSSHSDSKNELKDKHHIEQESWVFGILGRLSYEKGVDMAVDAFDIFCQKNPDIKAYLFIVGLGKEEPVLREMVRERKLEDRVVFTGFLDNPSEILPIFDVILSSSRREGLPLALLEGMSAGCLPVIFRVGGMPEVITNKDLGWVVEPMDTEGFAEAMKESVSLDGQEMKLRQQKILDHIKNNFDAENCFQQIINVFNLEAAR